MQLCEPQLPSCIESIHFCKKPLATMSDYRLGCLSLITPCSRDLTDSGFHELEKCFTIEAHSSRILLSKSLNANQLAPVNAESQTHSDLISHSESFLESPSTSLLFWIRYSPSTRNGLAGLGQRWSIPSSCASRDTGALTGPWRQTSSLRGDAAQPIRLNIPAPAHLRVEFVS